MADKNDHDSEGTKNEKNGKETIEEKAALKNEDGKLNASGEYFSDKDDQEEVAANNKDSKVRVLRKSILDHLGKIGEGSFELNKMCKIFGISHDMDFDAVYSWDQQGIVRLSKRPPDNFDTMNFLTGNILKINKKLEITAVDDLMSFFNTNTLSVGSPTSDTCSRLFMGLDKDPVDEDYMVEKSNKPLGFPFEFRLSRESVGDRIVTRKIKDHVQPRPAWYITSTGKDKKLFIPDTYENGSLKDDYLLITSIPNYLNIEGEIFNSRILNFGGTHGDATRATSSIFAKSNENIEFWRKIHGIYEGIRREDLRRYGIQILIRIGINEEGAFTGIVDVADSAIFGKVSDFETAQKVVKGWTNNG